MPKLYLLIGVPGSGKSTWVENYEFDADVVHVSSDYFVEEQAARLDTTYSNVFTEYMPTAVSLMFEEALEAKNMGMDIVWDQTNTTVSSRKKKLMMLPDYYKIAVVFKTPEHKELMRRLSSRPGKDIPDHVIASMISSLQLPTKEESFDQIIHAN